MLGRNTAAHKLWIRGEAQHYTHMYVFPQKWQRWLRSGDDTQEWVLFISFLSGFVYFNPLLCSREACKCCWKCAIIKVEVIGDTLTFCSAQITAMVIHKAWHLCSPHPSPALLSRKQLFVIKLFLYFCRPWISTERLCYLCFSLCGHHCSNWTHVDM